MKLALISSCFFSFIIKHFLYSEGACAVKVLYTCQYMHFLGPNFSKHIQAVGAHSTAIIDQSHVCSHNSDVSKEAGIHCTI